MTGQMSNTGIHQVVTHFHRLACVKSWYLPLNWL